MDSSTQGFSSKRTCKHVELSSAGSVSRCLPTKEDVKEHIFDDNSDPEHTEYGVVEFDGLLCNVIRRWRLKFEPSRFFIPLTIFCKIASQEAIQPACDVKSASETFENKRNKG